MEPSTPRPLTRRHLSTAPCSATGRDRPEDKRGVRLQGAHGCGGFSSEPVILRAQGHGGGAIRLGGPLRLWRELTLAHP